jgi:hypothetical protein
MRTTKNSRRVMLLLSCVAALAAAPVHAGTVPLWSEDFEGGTADWSFSGLAHMQSSSACTTASPGYVSSANALMFANEATCSYLSYEGGAATFGTPILVPASALSARMIFSNALSTENCCDPAQLEISTDGGSNWQLRSEWRDSFSGWQQESVDLSDLIGQEFLIRFSFKSDGSIEYNGWWVDDIAIEYDELGPGESAVRIYDVSEVEGNSGTNNFGLTVSVQPANPAPISITYDVYEGTATSASDFIVPTNRSFVIPANTSSYTLQIPVVGDEFREQDETFSVEITTSTGGAFVLRSTAVATIANDDEPTCQLDEGFDSGTANWIVDGPWQVISSSGCVDTPPSGWPVIGVVNEGTCGVGLAGQTITLETVDAIQIPENTLNAFLHFQYSTPYYGTVGTLFASVDDGASWFPFNYLGNTSPNWWSHDVSLNNYVGESIKFRFSYENPFAYDAGGIFLDDIRVCTENVPTGYSVLNVGSPLTFTETNTDQTVNIPISFSPATTAEVRLAVALNLSSDGSLGPKPTLVASEVVVPSGSVSALVPVLIPGDTFVEDPQNAYPSFTLTQGPALFLSDVGNYTQYNSTVTFYDDDLPICLLSDDFESGDGNWTLDGLWHVQTSTSCVSQSAVSGFSSLAFSDEFTCYLDSGLVGASAEIAQDIAIPLATTRARMRFTALASVDSYYGVAPLLVEASRDGGAKWEYIGQVYQDYSYGWQNNVFDMTAFAGDTVSVRLRTQNQYVYFSGAGWYIDDLSICYDPLPAGYHLVYVDHEVAETDATASTSVPIRITPTASYPVTIVYQTYEPWYALAPAVDGYDYTGASGNVTIPANASQAAFPLSIIGDDSWEPTEILGLALENTPPATNIVIRNTGYNYSNPFDRVTILDDDVISDLIVTGSGGEGSGVLTIRVTASPTPEQPITFDYVTSDDSAWEGLDYTPVAGTATIDAGEAYVDIPVSVVNDLFVEGTESIIFSATVTSGATFSTTYFESVIIEDNEPPAGYLISDEFEQGSGNWTASGLWHLQSNSTCLEPTDVGYVSPSSAMVYNDENFCAYTKSSTGYLTYNSVLSIPAQADAVTLSWYDWLETETGDLPTVQVSTDNGANWTTRYFSETTTAIWTYQQIDLTDLAGQSFQLRFGFTSDSDNTTAIGWYIDSVSLYVNIRFILQAM